MNWVIYNVYKPELLWSNGSGWTETEFDVFDDIERRNLNLPMGGAWKSASFS